MLPCRLPAAQTLPPLALFDPSRDAGTSTAVGGSEACSDVVRGEREPRVRARIELKGLLLPRRLQATSACDSQTRPERKIAGMQHWRDPPGRLEQPCPPHSPQVALQQT